MTGPDRTLAIYLAVSCLGLSTLAGLAPKAMAASVQTVVFDVNVTQAQTGPDTVEYTFTNSSASAIVTGFGVTNTTTTGAFIEGGFSLGQPTINGIQSLAQIWQAKLIDEAQWSTESILFDGGASTFEDVFGTFPYASGTLINWYEIGDASGLLPGDVATGFRFTGEPDSEAFGVGFDKSSGTAGTFSGLAVATATPVPLPAALPLLFAGAAALRLAGRRGQG